MKVFIWIKNGNIASVTAKQPLVVNKVKRDGVNIEDIIEVWENEKRLGVYHTAQDFLASLKPPDDEHEDSRTFW